MFKGASSFNQDIFNWDISNMAFKNGMFENTRNFNQENILKWILKNKLRIDDCKGSKIYEDKLKYMKNLENIINSF
jgi:hypothetical protein